jgi:phosphoserine aminotransferase
MKPLSISFITVLLALAPFSQAQTKTEASTSEIMKLKLDYAHYILNGIATENFALISGNAEKLGKLSQQMSWGARQTREFEVLSAEFRRNADALAKAAKDRNPDAASLAYVQMTLSCVNCHKYMRQPKEASLR